MITKEHRCISEGMHWTVLLWFCTWNNQDFTISVRFTKIFSPFPRLTFSQLFLIQEIISSQAKKMLGNNIYVFLLISHFFLNGNIECTPSQHTHWDQTNVCRVWIVKRWENCGKRKFKAISKFWLNLCWNSYVYHGIPHGPGLKHFPVVLLKTLIKPASALSFGKQPLRAIGKESLEKNHIVVCLDHARTKTVRHRKN